MKSMLMNRTAEYIEGASISRNKHMNNWRGEEPSKETLRLMIDDYLESIPDSFTTYGFEDFYKSLVSFADKLLDLKPRDELSRAVLVDYINWAARRFYGIDLALYTSDLKD